MPKYPDFDKLRATLHELNLEQAKQLYTELGTIVQNLERQSTLPNRVEIASREVVRTERIGDLLYQLERVRCGKVGCKCEGKDGELHGPYWYSYWPEDGRLRSRYVGKKLQAIE